MTTDPIKLSKIEEAGKRHADAVLSEPEKGRITGARQKRTQLDNSVGNVLTFKDNGLNRRFVVSVNIVSIDPEWRPTHPQDIAPNNGCDDELEKYQKVIKKFLETLHDNMEDYN